MEENDWDKGYKVGFIAGYESAMADVNKKVKPIRIVDPGPSMPDGLSYEEIYGSVVYQQNKKKD